MFRSFLVSLPDQDFGPLYGSSLWSSIVLLFWFLLWTQRGLLCAVLLGILASIWSKVLNKVLSLVVCKVVGEVLGQGWFQGDSIVHSSPLLQKSRFSEMF